MAGFRVLLALAAVVGSVVQARRPVREYEINLDLPPDKRYVEIVSDQSNGFNKTVWEFWDKYFAKDKVLTDTLFEIADKRGPEPQEMMGEIKGLAETSRLPFKFVKAIQMLYELQTLMVPVVNVSERFAENPLPAGYEALARIPWRGPGCTGIIARDKGTGAVYHARNLDFSPVPIMTNLVYTGVFTKNGKQLFRMQMVAGYVQMVTGIKMGPDGFALERNTRYPDHDGGNNEMFHNIESGRTLNGWTLRKVLEQAETYEQAEQTITTAAYVSTEFAILSGVHKGVIIARDPDSVAHTQTLGEKNVDERDDYIIITNFDFYYHDIREYFDPTGWCKDGCAKIPRRVAAQRLLNAQPVLTPEYLFEVINAKSVLADTIFQSVMSVQAGLWNVSQPDLDDGVVISQF